MKLVSIKNYYERYVMDEIHNTLCTNGTVQDDDLVLDIACLALNQLPSKYVRHDIDASFYMTPTEQGEFDKNVSDAVATAYHKVLTNSRPR